MKNKDSTYVGTSGGGRPPPGPGREGGGGAPPPGRLGTAGAGLAVGGGGCERTALIGAGGAAGWTLADWRRPPGDGGEAR